MPRFLKKIIEKIQKKFHKLLAQSDVKIIGYQAHRDLENLLKFEGSSKSQYKQDLFVLSTLKFKRKGFFVEFGATDGHELSNTFLLEKHFEWHGILAKLKFGMPLFTKIDSAILKQIAFGQKVTIR